VISVQTDHFSGRQVWRASPPARIVPETFFDLRETNDMGQMLQTHPRHALHPTPIQEVEYLTDGLNLYEVVAEGRVRNFGRAGGVLGYLLVRDCVTELQRRIGALELALCDPVCTR
jgi:hypothetical protein